jgi:predicted nucleic acid-binding protein
MRRVYADTSCFLAIALEQPEFEKTAERLESYEAVHSSTLMEAELRAKLHQQGIDEDGSRLTCWVEWVAPPRPLHAYIGRVLLQGVALKGADVWHLACALYTAERYEGIEFMSLDRKQLEAARRLGFQS